MYRSMAALAIAGTVVAALLRGWPGALGFVVGAIFSILNFWFWHRLVARVGDPGGSTGKGSVALFAMRYGAFAIGLYVTLQYFEASLAAALTGIFVAVAAVLLEALFELIYGT
jgi:hypothetical protein